jgi:putative ABC transport system permease protein
MIDIDSWKEIYNTLAKNKSRTILTAFGVFWGIFMLVFMLASGKGLENGVNAQFSNWASNSLFVWTQKTTKDYAGFRLGRAIEFENNDLTALKNNIPEIEILAPRHRLGNFWSGSVVKRNNKEGVYKVNGDTPDYNKIESLKIDSGRFINSKDIQDKRKVAIIGQKIIEQLYTKNEAIIGSYININEVLFLVVGTLAPPTRNDGEQLETIIVPFTTFQYTFNMGSKIGWFGITANKNVKAEDTQKKILDFLKQRHHIHPDDNQALGSWNTQKEFDRMQNMFLAIKWLAWIVGILTLAAGVIGVSNIMLIVVKERTKEIGIRRAIGAKPSKIVSQIISESVVLTSIAGYFGLLVGIVLIEGINYMLNQMPKNDIFFKNPAIDIKIALSALAILILSGILAGFIPAQRALLIKPVEALRAD